VWREQDAKNFYKALDHQGGTFKNNDKKTIAPKTLITEIEALRKEQHHRRAAMIDPSAAASRPRHQFAFKFEDKEVLKDCIKLVISYLDRFNGQLTSTDKDKIEHCLRDFVPLFFLFDKAEFDADFGDAEHTANDDDEASEADSDAGLSAADDDETAGSKRGKKTVLGSGGEDLRKRLLKTAAQEKNARAKRDDSTTPGPSAAAADENAEGSTSIEGTPALDVMDGIETPIPPPVEAEAVAEALEKGNAGADAAEETWVNMDTPADSRAASVDFATTTPQTSRKGNFFANQSFYVLVRLIQVLYSRLLTCKETADKLAKEGTSVQQINPLAYELGLADGSAAHAPYLEGSNPAAEYYGHLLGLCERLFENDVDVNVFEESLRLMYGNKAYIMFTVDKVVAAIIKQVSSPSRSS
jgi:paired amphipathic helix protein Sin3a